MYYPVISGTDFKCIFFSLFNQLKNKIMIINCMSDFIFVKSDFFSMNLYVCKNGVKPLSGKHFKNT